MVQHTCTTCAAADPRYQPEEYNERPGTDTTSPDAVYICQKGHVTPYAQATPAPAPASPPSGA